MRKRIIIYIIIFQIFLTLVIVNQIYKKNSIFGATLSVNPIRSVEQVFTKVDGLKYFHEPNNTTYYTLPWINYKVENIINKDHLKNTHDYSVNKDKNVFRILTIGDSFTYGLHVSTKDIWPEKLENLINSKVQCKKFNRVEVINLGVDGYDIQYELERYKLRGEQYSPDMVIWMVLDNDFDYIEEEVVPLMNKYKKVLADEGISQTSVDKNGNYHNYYLDLYKRAINDFKNKWSDQDTLNFQIGKLKEFKKYFKGTLVVFGLKHALDESKNITAVKEVVDNKKNSYFYKDENDAWWNLVRYNIVQ